MRRHAKHKEYSQDYGLQFGITTPDILQAYNLGKENTNVCTFTPGEVTQSTEVIEMDIEFDKAVQLIDAKKELNISVQKLLK